MAFVSYQPTYNYDRLDLANNTNSMSTKPHELSDETWKELFFDENDEDLREMWGFVLGETTLDEVKNTVYGVQFDFVAGSPGYVGDLIILQGDSLENPLQFIRNKDGKLEMTNSVA